MSVKKEIDSNVLYDLYINKNLSIRGIAKELNVGASTVRLYLLKYGITKSEEQLREQHRNACASDEVSSKRKATNLQKYGCENPMQNEMVKQKTCSTNMQKYGVKSTAQVTEFQEKRFETNEKKYGCKWPQSTESVKKKMKETCLEKYGCTCSLHNPEIQEKVKNTFKERYGNRAFGQCHLSEESVAITSSKENLERFMCENNIQTVKELTNALGRGSTGKVFHILKKYDLLHLLSTQESTQEHEVMDFVKSLGVRCYRDRSILKPFEIDIYCPDYGIGIEFNGTYWHSSLYKDRNYHFQKSVAAEEAGIRLIHIYEYEWEDDRTRPIIQSMLKTAFGLVADRVYARQCEVREITNAEAKPFVDANHLQGHRAAKVSLGLYHNGCLVQLMSFSHNKNYEWEIIRSCPKSDTIVVGGVSKLFNYFKTNYAPREVFSYADFNKFDGKGYASLGMEFTGYTGPDMKWIIEGEVFNRNPQKNAEMKERAEAQIWGAGSKRFLWRA